MSQQQSEKSSQSLGTLYIVPTPIGNLADMTERAVTTLQQVDLIAAEDTRHSRPLLQQYNVSTQVLSVHEHNESSRAGQLIEKLKQGLNIALISDAGMPLISDPGYVIVRECRAEQIPVVALPGACAFVTALAGSGLATDKFMFEGFLPAKSAARKKAFANLADQTRSVVFYESPHRIESCLEDLAEILPYRDVVLARELSKQYETYLSGTASELLAQIHEDSNQKRGEMVLMIGGVEKESAQDDQISVEQQRAVTLLMQHLPLKKAAAVTAELYGGRKNALYQWAIAQSDD
jgi:16S rRNA (cytidine1402-2'-O)-methyltransferase